MNGMMKSTIAFSPVANTSAAGVESVALAELFADVFEAGAVVAAVSELDNDGSAFGRRGGGGGGGGDVVEVEDVRKEGKCPCQARWRITWARATMKTRRRSVRSVARMQ